MQANYWYKLLYSNGINCKLSEADHRCLLISIVEAIDIMKKTLIPQLLYKDVFSDSLSHIAYRFYHDCMKHIEL